MCACWGNSRGLPGHATNYSVTVNKPSVFGRLGSLIGKDSFHDVGVGAFRETNFCHPLLNHAGFQASLDPVRVMGKFVVEKSNIERHIRLALDLGESLVDALNQRASKEGLSLLDLIQALLRKFAFDENKSNSEPQALPNLIQNLYRTMPKKSTN